MDRNFLIAILLTTLVVIFYTSPIYQEMFGSDEPQQSGDVQSTQETQSNQQQMTTPVDDEGDDITTEVTEEDSIPILRQDEQEEEDTAIQQTRSDFVQTDVPERVTDITLQNDTVKIVFTSRGAAIKKIYTINHTGPEEEDPAQLVFEDQVWCTGSLHEGEKVIHFNDVIFNIENSTNTSVTFNATFNDGKIIKRTYTLAETGYDLLSSTDTEGYWNEPILQLTWEGPLNMTEEKPKQLRIWPFSMFIRDENELYNKIVYLGEGDKIHEDTEGDKEEKRIYFNESPQKLKVKKGEEFEETFIGSLNWHSVRSKYFMSAVIPEDRKLWTTYSQGYMDRGIQWFNFSLYKKLSDGNTDVKIYSGPIQYNILNGHTRQLADIMELSWRFIRPLSIGFLWLIKQIHKFIPNWGLVIIVFSLIIKLVLYPLSRTSIKSMRKMSSLQPKIAEIKEKYKNNQQKQQQAIMALYKEEGVNPFGGCLPILLQMPVFFALYPVIGRAFELRQATFIPGWIEDLSRPDPFYILPVAMGISMFFQSKTTMTDPNQKAMLYTMPIFMVILFSNFSSGLTLYWFMFNIMTFVQQHIHSREEKLKEQNA